MKNIFEYINPMSGAKGNVLDLGKVWSNVLGVAFLFLVVTMGQTVANRVSAFIPNVSTAGTSLISTQAPVTAQTTKRIY